MKFQRQIPAVCLVLLVLLVGGCTSFHNPFSKSPDLAGTWENRHGSVWTLRSDGTFEIKHAGQVGVTGTYSIGKRTHRDQLTLIYTGGRIPWDGHQSATYRIKQDKRNRKKLRFVVLHDICALRIADLSVKWKKQNP